jgi:hypothetical protein
MRQRVELCQVRAVVPAARAAGVRDERRGAGGNPELSATVERVDESTATGDGADGGAGETVIAQAPTTPSDKSDVEDAPASEEEECPSRFR